MTTDKTSKERNKDERYLTCMHITSILYISKKNMMNCYANTMTVIQGDADIVAPSSSSSLALQDQSPRINLRGSISEDRSPRINLRGSISEDQSSRINIRGPIFEDQSSRINLRGSISEDQSPRINLRGSISEDQSSKTNSRGSIIEDQLAP